MRSRLKFLQLLLCGIVIGTIVGCDPPNSQNRAYETLAFNVDKTLLEPAITDTTLKMTIAAPKAWEKTDDTMLTQVIDQVSPHITQGLQMVPRWVFLNEQSRAICIVSRLEGIEITPNDTLLQSLETAYLDKFPKATVQRTAFLKDAFRIHQLMVGAPDFVLIKLICDAPESLIFEVDYVVPRNVYETELRAIESSIGSINLTNN